MAFQVNMLRGGATLLRSQGWKRTQLGWIHEERPGARFSDKQALELTIQRVNRTSGGGQLQPPVGKMQQR